MTSFIYVLVGRSLLSRPILATPEPAMRRTLTGTSGRKPRGLRAPRGPACTAAATAWYLALLLFYAVNEVVEIGTVESEVLEVSNGGETASDAQTINRPTADIEVVSSFCRGEEATFLVDVL